MLSETEQFNSLIKNAKHVLICFSQDKHIDSVVSALAMKNFLEKNKKQVDIICEKYEPPKNLRFIKNLDCF